MTTDLPKGIKSFKLGNNFVRDRRFIDQLYKREPYPIFEHNVFHILSYLSFHNELFGLEGKFGKAILCLSKNKEAFLFTPVINNFISFTSLINALKTSYKQRKICIQNVSQNWVRKVIPVKNKHLFNIKKRSGAEAIYDVPLLNSLSGKDFAKIRQSRNKLLNHQILTFEKLTPNNLHKALELLNAWQQTQGTKYQKNKYEKQKHTYNKLVELSSKDNSLIFEVGEIANKAVSVVAMFKSRLKPRWGIIYELKGLNNKISGGFHGVSDATYCHVFNIAKSKRIVYLNDGELGSEMGTREHKLRFKPVIFLKSFDVYI